jgi:two-component system alkaline phosphatase synthesis response regulator PhoP
MTAGLGHTSNVDEIRNHPRVLIVDDEPDILEFIEYNLSREGFDVSCASDGIEAIKVAREILPDLILLDIMMPKQDGIETCRQLRADPIFKQTIIAFLTARNEDFAQISGFEVGADDYITKPIKPRLLVSRVRALARRSHRPSEAPKVEVGDLVIDRERYVVFRSGAEVELPRKEFELLALLASKPGRVFKRHEIMSSVWGDEVIVGDRTIDVHVRKLREKFGDELIKTVKGIGYKINP